jgi:hypothetical protein
MPAASAAGIQVRLRQLFQSLIVHGLPLVAGR